MRLRTDCVRCGAEAPGCIDWIDRGVGICGCGFIYTSDRVMRIPYHVLRQARLITMAWARQPQWPWGAQRPPVAATGAPRGGDA